MRKQNGFSLIELLIVVAIILIIAAIAIPNLLRARMAAKRQGGALRVTFSEELPIAVPADAMLLALDDALGSLAKRDARKARVVELRFFVGLSVDETAEVLKISPESVMRDWRLAKPWLAREVARGEPHGA